MILPENDNKNNRANDNFQRVDADNRLQVEDTARSYEDLRDYTTAQGAPVQAFIEDGWKSQTVTRLCPQTKQPRPALAFETATGTRYRFIDSEKPKYTNPRGYKRSWYHLDQAINIATATGQPLVICNGEASSTVARYWNVAATCVTGGEKNIPVPQLRKLKSSYTEPIIVALDCDDTGRKAAAGITRQLRKAGYQVRMVDLGLSNGGDLGNFCKIHGQKSRQLLNDLPDQPLPKIEPKPVHKPANFQTRPADYSDVERERDHIKQVVIPDRLGITDRRVNADGFTVKRFANPFVAHENDDRSPASVYNFESGVLYDHKGDHKYKVTELCDLLNIEWPSPGGGGGGGKRIDLAAAPGELPSSNSNNHKLFDTKSTGDNSHCHKLIDESAPDTETESTPPVEEITGDAIHVNMPKIAHIPRDLVDKPGCYLIQSQQGTAKTGLLVDLMTEHLKGLTTLHTAHRTALVDSIGFRHGCYTSNDMLPDMQTQHEVFASCLPSILNQIVDGQLRQIDVITLDEIEQMLSALGAPELKHKRLQIFSTLVTLVKQAKYVYALDADASEVAYQFLKFCRDDVTVIINDYRDTSRKFRKFKSEEAVIDHAGDLLMQNTGIVAVNCSSEKKARKIGKRLAHLINDESAVLVVCKANEHEPHIREFLTNPDGHLHKYRAVVYTSKMGTGVDITTPIRAALGIYDRQPLTAFDQQQGLFRFRDAEIYGAWVTEVEQNYVTDQTVILDKWLSAEQRTRQTVSIFDVNGNDMVKEMRVALARLQASVQAREHRSKSNLHAHFYALAEERFTVIGEAKDISSTDKGIIKDDLKLHGEALNQERDDRTKAADPVDSEDYKKHAIRGTVTPDIEAGHRRWLIETTFNQDIDQQTIDDYDDGRGAARLKLLESLYKNEDSAKLRDTEELLANLVSSDLTHATMKRRLLLHAIRPFLNEDRQLSADTRIDLEDINDHLGRFRDEHEDDIRRYFKWRTDYDTKPINLLRFLLKECGLKLSRYKRTSEYHIDGDTLARMERYIDQRLGLQKSGKIVSAIVAGGG